VYRENGEGISSIPQLIYLNERLRKIHKRFGAQRRV